MRKLHVWSGKFSCHLTIICCTFDVSNEITGKAHLVEMMNDQQQLCRNSHILLEMHIQIPLMDREAIEHLEKILGLLLWLNMLRRLDCPSNMKPN